MSKLHVNLSPVAVDLEKIPQCVAASRAKQLFLFLLAKIFFRASKNDFRVGRCLLQLSRRASCKTDFPCTLSKLNKLAFNSVKHPRV